MLHQVDGRGAQKQELPGAPPGPPAPIDDAAQGSEQPRGPVYLVQHQELAGVDLAVLFDVDDLGEVARSFQVEIDGAAFVRDLLRQRGFAYLAGSGEDHSGVAIQQTDYFGFPAALYHLRKSNMK